MTGSVIGHWSLVIRPEVEELSERTPIVAGNWKMHKTIGEAQALVRGTIDLLGDFSGVEVAFAPPFTALAAIHQILLTGEAPGQVGASAPVRPMGVRAAGEAPSQLGAPAPGAPALRGPGGATCLPGYGPRHSPAGLPAQDSHYKLAAQDLFPLDEGAFTGLISPRMLVDAGCQYVIIGHSERRGRFGKAEDWLTPAVRALFGDNDETVGLKANVALEHRLIPIICIGETIDEREAGRTDEVVGAQLRAALSSLPAPQVGSIVLAYEPVWAIGTGHTCGAEEAERVCSTIRQLIAQTTSEDVAEGIRIQYGGSVKPENAQELLGQPNIDGALVGGASLQAESFAAIVRSALTGA